MKNTNEVSWKKLKYKCNPDIFNFVTTEELERKNNDLIQQIYYKEQEIKELRAVLDSQEQNFNKVIAGLCITIFGGR